MGPWLGIGGSRVLGLDEGKRISFKTLAGSLTSMNYIVVMKVVHSFQDLFDCLRCIFFCKFAIFADTVEELSTGSQLGNNVVFILNSTSTSQPTLL